jgi:hypothetical protein
MWFIFLISCFNGDSRSYAGYVAERDAVTDTAPMFSGCSQPMGDQRLVRFANPTEVFVQLWYIESDCEQTRIAELPAGGGEELMTAQGDIWRFREPGEPFLQELEVDGLSIYYEFQP